jgi:hypothetical protein
MEVPWRRRAPCLLLLNCLLWGPSGDSVDWVRWTVPMHNGGCGEAQKANTAWVPSSARGAPGALREGFTSPLYRGSLILPGRSPGICQGGLKPRVLTIRKTKVPGSEASGLTSPSSYVPGGEATRSDRFRAVCSLQDRDERAMGQSPSDLLFIGRRDPEFQGPTQKRRFWGLQEASLGPGAEKLVGAKGFEPSTSASRRQRSTKLSHAPTAGERGTIGPPR